jgi:hypothetical protein
MQSRIALLLTMLLGLAALDCSDTVAPPANTNLVANGSFESGGHPSSIGWDYLNELPEPFSSDVPPNGGSYAASLDANLYSVDIRTAVPALAGTHVYRLTVWGKLVPGSLVGGTAGLGLSRGDTVLDQNYVNFPDTVWITKSVGTSMTANPGDSVVVVLRAYRTLVANKSLFDRVALDIE